MIEVLVGEIQRRCTEQARELVADRTACAAGRRDLCWADRLSRGLGRLGGLLDPGLGEEGAAALTRELLAEGIPGPRQLSPVGEALVGVIEGYRREGARRRQARRDLGARARRLRGLLGLLDPSCEGGPRAALADAVSTSSWAASSGRRGVGRENAGC